MSLISQAFAPDRIFARQMPNDLLDTNLLKTVLTNPHIQVAMFTTTASDSIPITI
jgi:hypothetical protein